MLLGHYFYSTDNSCSNKHEIAEKIEGGMFQIIDFKAP